MKAWAIVHVGETVKSQLKITDWIVICKTRADAINLVGFDEKIIQVEIKEIK